MRRYKVTYFAGQAFKGLWRNGMMTIASVIVLFSCLVVMGCFSMIVLNLNKSLSEVDSMNKIYVFVDSVRKYKTDSEVSLASAQVASEGNNSFLGWSTDPDSKVAHYRPSGTYIMTPSDAVGDTVTLYAIWDGERSFSEYTVRYSSYGKQIKGELPEAVSYAKGSEVTVANAPTPYYSADSFLGWSTTPGASKAELGAGDIYKINPKDAKGGVITLYAVWNTPSTFEEYNIVYEMNGVKVDDPPTSSGVYLNSVKSKLQLINGIGQMEYISKNETLEDQKQEFAEFPGLLDLLENMKEEDNPYPDTFVFSYEEGASIDGIKEELTNLENKGVISSYRCRVDIAQKIENLKSGVVFIFTWFMIILFIVSLSVIINTIKLALATRHKEIEIMRYVGATKVFIALPFHLEGLIIGLISGGFAFLADWLVYRYIETNMQVLQIIQPMPFSSIKAILLIGSLVIGGITGFIGSALSIRKHLKT